ncbi:hypothetical protein HWV62_12512 [Athelia sp. TMB]|nr:hypothetical protein HWV62_12512 [Athelia sp. TMB]
MPDEVVGIWQRPKTFVSWLYIINRYLATIGNAVFFALVFKELPLEVSAHAIDQVCFKHSSKSTQGQQNLTMQIAAKYMV